MPLGEKCKNTVLKMKNKESLDGWLDPKHSLSAPQVFYFMGTVYNISPRIPWKLCPEKNSSS